MTLLVIYFTYGFGFIFFLSDFRTNKANKIAGCCSDNPIPLNGSMKDGIFSFSKNESYNMSLLKWIFFHKYYVTSKWDKINIFEASAKIINNANFIFWGQIKQRIWISSLLVNALAVKRHYRDAIYVRRLTYFIYILEICSFSFLS